jgi:hypothetical protein
MVKHVDAVELRKVVAAVLAVAADAALVAQHILNLVPIWLPRWLACMCTTPREEATWRREASGRKRAGRIGGNARNSVLRFGTGNSKCRLRARVYPEREN